jgi:hypothetical protein
MSNLSIRRARSASTFVSSIVLAVALLLTVSQVATSIVSAAEPSGAWTLDQARAHLRLYPHDAYVEYVALQLARREGKVADVAREIAGARFFENLARQRRDSVDLFSIFSGALAVQESLQLDAMIADQPGIAAPGNIPADRRPRIPQRGNDAGRTGPRPLDEQYVTLKDLAGPTIKSHPWDQMLAGRKPQVSRLAHSVPADFYFAEFRSVNKLTEASKIADLWGTHLFNQAVQEAETQLVDQRVREQLAVEVNPLLAPFYDAIVQRVAVAGSDLFLREGSDVTLLFEVSQPAIFRAQMDRFLEAAAAKPDAKRSSGTYQGVDFKAVETPDRRIRVFSAYPNPDLHVRTNSRVALERIIDAIHGHTADGKPVRSLGETSEFAYIRTLMPPGAPEEDGLIYLSDPFMRHMVGPELRLAERRRMVCYNNLKMISHAALMYRTEHGKSATSLAELATAGCVPGEFGAGMLTCPDGGAYTLADDGLTGVCSQHGYARYLTPCSEIEIHNITAPEATAYREFVDQYNSYWRLYFDPIAIRLTVTPQRYRAETIVLPLIDNSVYTGLASALGGKPEQLDALPVPDRNIFSLAVRFDKRALLHQMRMDELIEESEPASDAQRQLAEDIKHSVDSLKKLELAILIYESAHKRYPTAATVDSQGRPLLSWRVEILPYLEQQELYEQFHRDEPWDSEHNKQLISRMPEVFRPHDAKLAQAGKTKFVAPRGNNTVFPSNNHRVLIKSITDGTSQTIQLVEATDDRAVIWTKPDDLEINPERPAQGLESRSGNGYLVAVCDGSIQKLNPKIDNAALAAAFTRSGREVPAWHNFVEPLPTGRARTTFLSDMPAEIVQQLRLGQVVSKGIGNQISFNVYDAQQLFDLSLPKALGWGLGSFRGTGARSMSGEFWGIAFLLGSLNSPVYIAIPIKNREVVDDFLTRLDSFLAQQAHDRERDFIELERDFYQIPGIDAPIRACAVGFGPVKWRFFFERIGDAVYIASQRNILEDLAALNSKGGPAPVSNDSPAHALVRLRPQHWKQVLDHYRLGWEENNRQACLKNLGPLSSLGRALVAGRGAERKPLSGDELAAYTARLYDVRYFCPDDGQYVVSADGSVACSKHGSAAAPRQSIAPATTSELGKLLGEFSDMSLSLTFLDDGLHAVVDLERKK